MVRGRDKEAFLSIWYSSDLTLLIDYLLLVQFSYEWLIF